MNDVGIPLGPIWKGVGGRRNAVRALLPGTPVTMVTSTLTCKLVYLIQVYLIQVYREFHSLHLIPDTCGEISDSLC